MDFECILCLLQIWFRIAAAMELRNLGAFYSCHTAFQICSHISLFKPATHCLFATAISEIPYLSLVFIHISWQGLVPFFVVSIFII